MDPSCFCVEASKEHNFDETLSNLYSSISSFFSLSTLFVVLSFPLLSSFTDRLFSCSLLYLNLTRVRKDHLTISLSHKNTNHFSYDNFDYIRVEYREFTIFLFNFSQKKKKGHCMCVKADTRQKVGWPSGDEFPRQKQPAIALLSASLMPKLLRWLCYLRQINEFARS